MTADDKYSRWNMQNFPQELEAPLSHRQMTFSGILIAFLKFVLNLEYFGKENQYPCLITSKLTHSERGGYLNV